MNSGKRKGKELSSPVHYKDPVGKPAINVAKKKKKKERKKKSPWNHQQMIRHIRQMYVMILNQQ